MHAYIHACTNAYTLTDTQTHTHTHPRMQKKKKDEKTPTQNGKESLSLVEDNEVTLKNLTDQILQLEQR